jgi:hypothetical protein
MAGTTVRISWALGEGQWNTKAGRALSHEKLKRSRISDKFKRSQRMGQGQAIESRTLKHGLESK